MAKTRGTQLTRSKGGLIGKERTWGRPLPCAAGRVGLWHVCVGVVVRALPVPIASIHNSCSSASPPVGLLPYHSASFFPFQGNSGVPFFFSPYPPWTPALVLMDAAAIPLHPLGFSPDLLSGSPLPPFASCFPTQGLQPGASLGPCQAPCPAPGPHLPLFLRPDGQTLPPHRPSSVQLWTRGTLSSTWRPQTRPQGPVALLKLSET